MGNILAFKFYLADFLIDQAGNGVQDGCLAGAIGTDQRDNFSFINFKGDALQRLDHTIIYL